MSDVRDAWWFVAIALATGCQGYDRNTYLGLIDGAGTDATNVDAVLVDSGLDVAASDASDGISSDDGVGPAPDVPTDVPGDIATDASPDVPVDAGLDPTSCDDMNAGAIFCDGFENSALAGWALQQSNGTAMRSTTEHVYRGRASLRAEATAASGYAYLFNHSLGGVTSGDLYVRGYYYFPSGTVLSRVTFMTSGQSVSPYYSVQMRVLGELATGYNGANFRDVNSGPGAIVPRDRWVCMEYRVHVDDTAGSVDLYMDGDFIGGAMGLDTLAATGYAQLSVGIVGTSASQAPVVVYVDEVVASATRVGCDP